MIYDWRSLQSTIDNRQSKERKALRKTCHKPKGVGELTFQISAYIVDAVKRGSVILRDPSQAQDSLHRSSWRCPSQEQEVVVCVVLISASTNKRMFCALCSQQPEFKLSIDEYNAQTDEYKAHK